MVDRLSRAELRSHGRRTRVGLVGAEREQAEAAVIRHLRSLLVLQRAGTIGSGTVGTFIAHDGEPDLGPLVPWLRMTGSAVALPIVADAPGDYTMNFVPWRADEPLEPGRYGIGVPRSAPPVDPCVTLVSCVAFDADGNRIGRGAGYFDRYLAGRDTVIVGVAFERQRVDSLPTAPHDVGMDLVVTDLGVRHINPRRAARSQL